MHNKQISRFFCCNIEFSIFNSINCRIVACDIGIRDCTDCSAIWQERGAFLGVEEHYCVEADAEKLLSASIYISSEAYANIA